MKQLRNTQLFTSALAKVAVAMALLFFNSFFVRAQGSKFKVLFPFDSDVVLDNYLNNAETLASFEEFVTGATLQDQMEIVTYSSPEGNWYYNKDLSLRRAQSIQRYLENKYPAVRGKLSINPGVEAWDALRASVQGDSRLGSATREAVLSIIDSDVNPDTKESQLAALPEYKSLYRNYFRSLRYAEIVLNNTASSGKSVQESKQQPLRDNSTRASVKTIKEGLPIVYYILSEDVIRPQHMGNDINLKEIRRIITSGKVKSLVIEGAASPEGPLATNEKLSRERAQNLVDYIIGMRPELEGHITIRSLGENWAGLRDVLENETRIQDTWKQEILDIIDSNVSDSAKKANLMAHPAYEEVREYCFPYIRMARFADMVVEEEESVESTGSDEVVDVTEPKVDTLDITTPVEPVDTTSAIVFPPVIGQDTDFNTKTVRPRKTIAAVKTNLLYDAVTALNVEVEVPIGKRWSVMVEDVFPWWETSNKYCFQMWEMGIEGRFWLKPWDVNGTQKLRGWFAGPYVMSSKYDFQYDTSINYQGEYWSVGATAGYAMPIGRKKRLNLEFSLSLGYLQSPYRHYMPTDSYDKLIRDPSVVGTVKYFGPTKAKISLVLPINIPTKKQEVNHE